MSKLNNGQIHEDALEYKHNIPHAKRVDSGTKSETQRQIQEKKEVADQLLQSAQKPSKEEKPVVSNVVEHDAAQNNEEEQSEAAAEAARGVPEIPKFNLAEQILAEQRKVSAVRRKGPGRARQIQAAKASEAAGARIIESASSESPVKDIVSEIVARDIEQMLHSNTAPVPKDTRRSD